MSDLLRAIRLEAAASELEAVADNVPVAELQRTSDAYGPLVAPFWAGYRAAIDTLHTRARQLRAAADQGPHIATWTPYDDTNDGVCD